MISIKNHSYTGYEFPAKKQFVCGAKQASFLKPQKFIEIRFLCGLNCISKTHNHLDFFDKCSKDYASAIFMMVPYFHQKIDTNDEYCVAYEFRNEVNIKLFWDEERAAALGLSGKINYGDEYYKIKCKFLEYKTQTPSKVDKKVDKPNTKSTDNIDNTDNTNNTENNGITGNVDNSALHLPPLPKKQITSSILKIIEHMKKGECYLANITHTQNFKETKNLFSAHHFLIKWFTQKPTFGFYLAQKDIQLASFSPERFLIKKRNMIATQPIKGTQKMGKPRLWQKKKEMYEHTMVVDLLRHDLNAVCVPGSVAVQNPFYIKCCHSILQMQSSIVGKLPKEYSFKDLMNKMLPGGSISGTPKKRVCEFIEKYESQKRGYYTGIAGIIELRRPQGRMITRPNRTLKQQDDFDFNFDFAILIRSLFKGRHGVYTGVGAGITTLSSAEQEFEEFCLKLKSFL